METTKFDKARRLAEALSAVSKDVFGPVHGTHDSGVRLGVTTVTEWRKGFSEEDSLALLDTLIKAREAGLAMAKAVLAEYSEERSE